MAKTDVDERSELKAIPYVEKNEYNDLQFFAMKYKLNIAVVESSTGKIMRRTQPLKKLKMFSKNCSLKRVASVQILLLNHIDKINRQQGKH